MRRRNSWPSTWTVSHSPSSSLTLRGIRSASSAGRPVGEEVVGFHEVGVARVRPDLVVHGTTVRLVGPKCKYSFQMLPVRPRSAERAGRRWRRRHSRAPGAPHRWPTPQAHPAWPGSPTAKRTSGARRRCASKVGCTTSVTHPLARPTSSLCKNSSTGAVETATHATPAASSSRSHSSGSALAKVPARTSTSSSSCARRTAGGGEAIVGCQVDAIGECANEALPLVLLRRSEEHPAIGGVVDAIERVQTAQLGVGLESSLVAIAVDHEVGHRACHGREHRGDDRLATGAAVARGEAEHERVADADRGEAVRLRLGDRPGRLEVARVRADLLDREVGTFGNSAPDRRTDDAAGRRDARRERRTMTARIAVAVPRRMDVHEVGIASAHRRRVEPVTRRGTCPPSLEHRVGALGDPQHDLRAFQSRRVDADAVLALHDLGPRGFREARPSSGSGHPRTARP